MRTNVKQVQRTHEGAPALQIPPLTELRRAVVTCLLFEDMFYESGVNTADRIHELALRCKLADVTDLAFEARHTHNLRHVPLWLLTAALNHPNRSTARTVLKDAIVRTIKRADDLTELVAMYWKDGKKPLSAVLKEAIAMRLQGFDHYQLAKYAKREGSVRLRDLLFLTHAKPKDEGQAQLWRKLADDELESADTWEVALSAGANKGDTFSRLLAEGKLGALAILRNLRNMQQAGVDKALVATQLNRLAPRSGILPFQYIAAARACPAWEDMLEAPMLASLSERPKLDGHTALLIDISGSMNGALGGKSTLNRCDAARALAILVREQCDEVTVFVFHSQVGVVPSRRGFALADAIPNPAGGTDTQLAAICAIKAGAKRIIIITDEQSATALPALPVGVQGYVMNVATYRHSIAWGRWIGINGFSEGVLDFIYAAEKEVQS